MALANISTALTASFLFIHAKPMRVKLNETEELSWISPLERIRPCAFSFSVSGGIGTDLSNLAQLLLIANAR